MNTEGAEAQHIVVLGSQSLHSEALGFLFAGVH